MSIAVVVNQLMIRFAPVITATIGQNTIASIALKAKRLITCIFVSGSTCHH